MRQRETSLIKHLKFLKFFFFFEKNEKSVERNICSQDFHVNNCVFFLFLDKSEMKKIVFKTLRHRRHVRSNDVVDVAVDDVVDVVVVVWKEETKPQKTRLRIDRIRLKLLQILQQFLKHLFFENLFQTLNFKNALFLDHERGQEVSNSSRKRFGSRIFFRRIGPGRFGPHQRDGSGRNDPHQRVGEAEVVVADVAQLGDEADDVVRASGRSSPSLHSETFEEETAEQLYIFRRLKDGKEE